jgi:hypothetical protein
LSDGSDAADARDSAEDGMVEDSVRVDVVLVGVI